MIRNPWDVGISGSIRLHDTDDIQLSPRRREVSPRFNLNHYMVFLFFGSPILHL